MIKIFFDVIWVFIKMLFPLIAAVLVLAAVFFALCFYWLFYYRKQGMRIQGTPVQPVKPKNIFYQLLVLVPQRYALDIYERPADYFRECGIHMFCGEQGAGKTVAMVEAILRLQKQYPKSKTITNFALTTQDRPLDHWEKLLTYNNGKKGVIVGIDEIQNWFMSGMNKLPPEMLEVVTQNRKNRRILFCTAQVFTKVNKGIREQVTLVYEPITFLGCFTIVRKLKPVFDSEGNVKERKFRGWYSFVHTKEIREAYDTYRVIHTLAKEGFKDPTPAAQVNNTVVISKK